MMHSDESEAFSVAHGEAPSPPKQMPVPIRADVAKYEEALAARRQRPNMPSYPMTSGVFSFPFYPTSLGALGTIGLGLSAMGLLARAQMAFFPF